MDSVHKKVREAAFFLAKLAERERLAFGEHEEFDFYLSAFLSAARSVDYLLRSTYDQAYKFFFNNTWAASPQERRLIEFLKEDRDIEVHDGGSRRVKQEERISVGGHYKDASGEVIVAECPGWDPPAEIIKPKYTFIIDGVEKPVVDSCAACLDLIGRLVRDYDLHRNASSGSP